MRVRFRGGLSGKFTTAIWILLCITLFAGTVAGIGLKSQKEEKYKAWVYENGTHVFAEVYAIDYSDDYYYARYRYTDENYSYYGTAGKFLNRAAAEEVFGKEIEIIVDGKGTSVRADKKPDPMQWRTMIAIAGSIAIAAFAAMAITAMVNLALSVKRKTLNAASVKRGLLGLGIVSCLFAIFGGMVLGNLVMLFTGLGVLIGGSIVGSIVAVVFIFARVGKPKKVEPALETQAETFADGSLPEEAGDEGSDGTDEEDPDAILTESEREERAIREINSTYNYENRRVLVEREVGQIKANYRAADGKSKVFGCLFLILLLSLLAGFPIFMVLGYKIPAFCCIGAFAFVILLSLVIVKVRQKISRGTKGYDLTDPREGKVLSCTFSSESRNGDRTVRVHSTVYKVRVAVDGGERMAYTATFFNEGEIATVYLHRRYAGLAKIVKKEGEGERSVRYEAERIIALEEKLREINELAERELAETKESETEERISLELGGSVAPSGDSVERDAGSSAPAEPTACGAPTKEPRGGKSQSKSVKKPRKLK